MEPKRIRMEVPSKRKLLLGASLPQLRKRGGEFSTNVGVDMMGTLTRRPLFALYLTATLAVLQAVVALLRSFELFRIGADLTGRGVLLIPLMGLITVARGGLIAVVAALYVLFAWGALLGKPWGWWAGLMAAVINVLLVLSLALQGEAIIHSLVWATVPAIVLFYLFAPAGRELLKH